MKKLNSLLLSLLLVLSMVVPVYAEEPETVSKTVTIDAQDITSDIIKGNETEPLKSDYNYTITDWSHLHDFNSLKGDVAIVMKTKDGKYIPITNKEVEEDGVKTSYQIWGSSSDTLDSALEECIYASEFKFSTIEGGSFNLEDYLVSNYILVVDKSLDIILEKNIKEFMFLCSNYTFEDITLDISTKLGSSEYNLNLNFSDTDEPFVNIEILQNGYTILTDYMPEDNSFTFTTELVNDLDILISTMYRDINVTVSIDDLIGKHSVGGEVILKEPKLTVEGIPNNIVTEPFKVKLSTDVACELYDSDGHLIGNSPCDYEVSENGSYLIYCRPTKDILEYVESEQSFEITCFKAIPISDDTEESEEEETKKDTDEPIIDINDLEGDVSNNDSLAQTGVNKNGGYLLIGLFIILGIILLVKYKKKAISTLLIFALVISNIAVTKVKASNNSVTGNGKDINDRNVVSASGADLCYGNYNIGYIVYALNINNLIDSADVAGLTAAQQNTKIKNMIYGSNGGWYNSDVRAQLNIALQTSNRFIVHYDNRQRTNDNGAITSEYRIARCNSNSQLCWLRVPALDFNSFKNRIQSDGKVPGGFCTLTESDFYTSASGTGTNKITYTLNNLDSYFTGSVSDKKKSTWKAKLFNDLFGVDTFKANTISSYMLVVEPVLLTHINGNYGIYYGFGATATESSASADEWKRFLGGFSAMGTNFSTKPFRDTWYYKGSSSGSIGVVDVLDLVYNDKFRGIDLSTNLASKYKGVGFIFNDDVGTVIVKEPFRFYSYAILAKGKVPTDFKTSDTKVPYSAAFVRKTTSYTKVSEVTGDTKKYLRSENEKTTYHKCLLNDEDDGYWSRITKLDDYVKDTVKSTPSNGYNVYGDTAKYSFITSHELDGTSIKKRIQSPNVTFKYTGSVVTGSDLNIGKTYKISGIENYSEGLSFKSNGADKITFADGNDNGKDDNIKNCTLDNFDAKKKSFIVKDSSVNKQWYSDADGVLWENEVHIPVIWYTEYKTASATTKIYNVNAKLDSNNKVVIDGSASLLKTDSYSVDSTRTYTVPTASKGNYTYVVVTSSDKGIKTSPTSVSKVEDLGDWFNGVVKEEIITTGDKISYGANTNGTGYNIYLISIAADNLNISGNYNLSEYSINKIVGSLSSAGKVLTRGDGSTYGKAAGTGATAYLYQLNGTRGKHFSSSGLVTGNLAYKADNSRANVISGYTADKAISYAVSSNNYLASKFSTKTDYKQLDLLKTYKLKLSRHTIENQKVLSSIAQENLSGVDTTTYGLGFGIKGNANTNYTANTSKSTADTNILQLTGRFPNNLSIKSLKSYYGTVDKSNNVTLVWKSGDTNFRWKTTGSSCITQKKTDSGWVNVTHIPEIQGSDAKDKLVYSSGKWQFKRTGTGAFTKTLTYDNYKDHRAVSGYNSTVGNYLLQYTSYPNIFFRTLNYTANITVNSYNSGTLATGKADTTLNKVNDKTFISSESNGIELKFYPEVKMLYNTSAGNSPVPVMGEYLRKTESTSLYGFKFTSDTAKGKTSNDYTATDGAALRGSDLTLTIDTVGLKLEAFGYGLDVINKSTDGTMKAGSSTINYNTIANDVEVYSAWGNSGTSNAIKTKFNSKIEEFIKSPLKVNLTMAISNGKKYNEFDSQFAGISYDKNATKQEMTFPITVTSKGISNTAGYQRLIKQIALDYGITEAEAKDYFASSDIANSIVESMETCINAKNKSIACKNSSGTVILGNSNHWYDEYTRTFVIRRYSNSSFKFGSIVVQDKVDMNANTSSSQGAGIHQEVTGTNKNATWNMIIKRDSTELYNGTVNGADFKVSYLTTED